MTGSFDFSFSGLENVGYLNSHRLEMRGDYLGEVSWDRLVSWRTVMLLFVASCCCGCNSTVRVTEDFPSPLVDTLPLRIGLRYREDLVSYVYEDTGVNGSGLEIDIGAGNERLFERVFATLFESVIRLEGVRTSSGGGLRLDLIIEPRLDSYTLQEPAETGLEFYYVSILYLLDFFSPQGELIASWPVEGYGRSRSGWVGTNEAIQKATSLAMRDAAARIALELVDHSAIQQALNASTATITMTPHAGPS